MRKLIIFAIVTGLPVTVAAEARASDSGNHTRICYQNPSNGEGYCYGNAEAWVEFDGNDDDYLRFVTYSSGSGYNAYFETSDDGNFYFCDVSSSLYPAVASAWPNTVNLGSGYQYFYIAWDSNGYCQEINYAMNTMYNNPQ